MAKPTYKLKKGATRTPEEHRRILGAIDELQHQRSKEGVEKSNIRLQSKNVLSKSAYKKSRAPKKKKERIYDIGRYARE